MVKLNIFEADHCLGGVWNRDRVYDELLTMNIVMNQSFMIELEAKISRFI